MKKIAYIILGILFLGLGLIGIILPILPTVKFFVIASICFVKGSHRFDVWFRNSWIYEKYLVDFVQTKTLTQEQKVHIIVTVTLLLLIPYMLVDLRIMKIVIGTIMAIKYFVIIFMVKTKEV